MLGLILLGVFVVVGFWLMTVYNRLVASRNGYKNAFSQIDVQLQRRHDLIPNLVETAKSYMKHERETLEAVITARNSASGALRAVQADPTNAAGVQKLNAAEGVLGGLMSRFMAVVEAYPDLKANQNMAQLSSELSETEDQIAGARQTYNDEVLTYNNLREVFPNNLVAGAFSFSGAEFLKLDDEAARKPVKVSFS